MNPIERFTANGLEGLPWPVRALLGFAAASLAVALTYSVEPLRAFPLLLAFPTVILAAWFLGMWGGAACALTDAILVDRFLTRSQFRFSVGDAREQLRLALFFTISVLLCWIIRTLARQRAEFITLELQQRLRLANTERELAEERIRTSEALRQQEALMQIAVKANGMAFWVWDPVKDISYWSDEMYRMIGREPGSIEASSLAWLGAIYPEDSQDAKRAMVQALRRGEDYHNQYRVVWPDGSIHWVEARGKFERNTDNRITRVIGVSTDITDRKRAENAMLRAEKLAVAGRLAASVAHEINNPLEAVSNLLYLISISETAESAHQLAREALDQLMRVSMITQQTLKFHRQAGAPKLASLAEIAHSALGMFRGKLAQANIAVEFEAPREDTGVLCMPNEIQQVFANLISNAVEAMPNNGRLAIRLRPSRHWLDSITKGMRITFLDSGTGMDRNTKRRLFEPFFTTKIETGTGLGMWVVAQLIERHHGHIRVWSSQRPQHTATAFSIFLPFQPTGAAAGANPAESPATEVTSNAEVRTLANATD